MKKRLAALLVLALSVTSLAACSDNGETSTETASVQSTELAEATTSPTIDVVQDEADLSNIKTEDYVALGDYQNLTVSVTPVAELSDDDVELYATQFLTTNLKVLTTDEYLTEGVVADSDVVLIDYEGKKDGEAFSGGTASNATLGIGTGMFIEGFEEGLIGVSVGETVDLNLTFPEEYPNNEELAGQDVVFTVTVKGLVGRDKYKEAVKEYIDGMNQYTYYQELNTAICDELLNICTVSKLPSKIYEDYKNVVINSVSEEAAYYGTDADTYTNTYVGMNLADYAISVSEAYTTQALVFQAIANEQGLVPSEEDINTFVEEYVESYGASYGIDSVEAFYENNSAEEVKVVLLQENVVNYLAEHANITDAE